MENIDKKQERETMEYKERLEKAIDKLINGNFCWNDFINFKGERKYFLEAVKQKGWALMWASDDIKADKEIALIAVKNDDRCFPHLSKELLNDKEVVLEGLRKNEKNIVYVGDELQKELIGKDKIKYLEEALHKEQLENEMTPKQEAKQTKQHSKI